MLGTIVNAVAIIVGAIVGVFLKKGIPEGYKATIINGLGLSVLVIGLSGALGSQDILLMIASVVIGTILGEALKIEKGLENIGYWIENKAGSKEGGIAKGFIDPWKDPSEYDPDAQIALLVYGTSMTTRPEVANRFMTAYVKSLRDYNDAFFKNKNKSEIIEVLCKYSVIKEPALYNQMFPTGLNPDGYLRMNGIAADLQWYKENNLLKSDIQLADAVDNQYVDFAVKTLGKYQ